MAINPDIVTVTGRSSAALALARASELFEAKRGAPSFAPHDLIAMAEAFTGERRPNLPFLPGLTAFVSALESEGGLDALGRRLAHREILRWLCNGFRLEANLNRRADVSSVPIREPLFIVGFTRTGSTFLHALLALDDNNRTPSFWELLEPFPPPGEDAAADSRRIANAEGLLREVVERSPSILKIHAMEARAPDECHYLMGQLFVSPHYCLPFNLPSYLKWLKERPNDELEIVYRYYRKAIQYLQLFSSGKRWVSKTFVHQYFLSSLLKVFPDAKVVRLHREPGAVISSLSSLAATARSMYVPAVDLAEVGKAAIQLTLTGAERMLAYGGPEQDRFCDISFDEIVKQPAAAIRKIYEAFGYEFTSGFHQRLDRYVASHPRERTGKHKHRLEDFGLHQHQITESFAPYLEWLDERRIAY